MKKYDILLTYETKNREVENLCLIKRELERRGYNVGMCMQYDTYFKTPEPVEAEVIAIPAYYRPRAKFYTSSHLNVTKKIVNLRWEQVFNNLSEDDPNTLCSIKDWGRDAVHISWGARPSEMMTDLYGVPEDHVKLCGHTTLDYLRGNLRNYFDSRETLFARYDIPADKRVNLFISSLTLTTMHSHVIKNSTNAEQAYAVNRMVDVAKTTQKEIVSWFEKILEEKEDDIIVYRPHPEERSSAILRELAERQPRFRVISEESVKQWILACDKIYSWVSTSIAEVYAAGKGCTILRPVEIPYENVMKIYNGAEYVDNYEDFREAFIAEDQKLGIDESLISRYYYIDENKYSYELVCDAIEEVYKDDKYLLAEPLPNPFGKTVFNGERIKNFIKRMAAGSKLANYINKKDLFPNSKFRYLLDDVIYVREKLKKNCATDEEIADIIKKIDSVM